MVREHILGHSFARVPFMPPLITFLHPTSNTFVVFAGRCRIRCQNPECPSSVSKLLVAASPHLDSVSDGLVCW